MTGTCLEPTEEPTDLPRDGVDPLEVVFGQTADAAAHAISKLAKDAKRRNWGLKPKIFVPYFLYYMYMASREEPRWEEPPPVQGRGRTGVWVRRLTPLMDHPGRWANLGEANPNIGTALKRNHVKRPPGEWEFKFRKKNAEGVEARKGRGFFYARYLGPSPPGNDGDRPVDDDDRALEHFATTDD